MAKAGLERPEFTVTEMTDLVAYLYFLRYIDEPGNSVSGQRLFTANCARCHAIKGEGGKAGPDLRKSIGSGAKTNTNLCWTCGSCDPECPMNVATGRLRPQKIVRLANLGLLEELMDLPAIWYCLTCRRCSQACPNAVKPSAIIEYIRMEMISRGLISWDSFQQYRK